MSRHLAITPAKATGAEQVNLFGGPGEAVYSHADVERGRALRAARTQLGLDVAEGAKRLGLSPTELRDCERGAYSFDLNKACELVGRTL